MENIDNFTYPELPEAPFSQEPMKILWLIAYHSLRLLDLVLSYQCYAYGAGAAPTLLSVWQEI